MTTKVVDAPPALPTAIPARTASPYLMAICVYVMVRTTGYLVLLFLADHHDRSIIQMLTSWDGDWYLAIAEHGFDGVPDSHRDAAGQHTPVTPYGFFPAFPMLVRAVAATGMGVEWAGLIVSFLAGLAATLAIFRIGRLVGGSERVGLVLVALWGAAPMSIVLSMTYTEALFTACAAWALVGVLEKRWYLAGLCSVAAGLTRSTAVVVVAVVGVAALIAVLRNNDRWRAIVCVVICPLGLLGWWGLVAYKAGSLTGWFDIQREGWFTRFDGGVQTLEFVGDTLATGKSLFESIVVLALLTAVALAVLSGLNRLPWPLVAYGAGVVIVVIGTAGLTYLKGRFLLPGFTLLIPVAIGLANRQPRTTIAAVSTYTLIFAWFNAYALTGWPLAV
ncbi:hypothetical protein [Actinophytocola sp.]|uniref:hypothetical protein n=1 Tax=Actinophytocola sp. TaxID=1872138 RepID=UPI002ED19C43